MEVAPSSPPPPQSSGATTVATPDSTKAVQTQVYRFPVEALAYCAICRRLLYPVHDPMLPVIHSAGGAVLEWTKDVPRVSHASCFDRMWAPVLQKRRLFLPDDLYRGMTPEDQALVRRALESGSELDKVIQAAPRMGCTCLLSPDFTTAVYSVHKTDRYLALSATTAVPYLPLPFWYDAYTVLTVTNDTVPDFASRAKLALATFQSDEVRVWCWHAADETKSSSASHALHIVLRVRGEKPWLGRTELPAKKDRCTFLDLYQAQYADDDLKGIMNRFIQAIGTQFSAHGLIEASDRLPVKVRSWTHRTHLYDINQDQDQFALAVNVQYETYAISPSEPPVSIVFGPLRHMAHVVQHNPALAEVRNILYQVPAENAKDYLRIARAKPL